MKHAGRLIYPQHGHGIVHLGVDRAGCDRKQPRVRAEGYGAWMIIRREASVCDRREAALFTASIVTLT
jgi:hypothetical protein